MHEALHLAGRSGLQEAADEASPFSSDEAPPTMPQAVPAGARGGDQSQQDVIAEIDQQLKRLDKMDEAVAKPTASKEVGEVRWSSGKAAPRKGGAVKLAKMAGRLRASGADVVPYSGALSPPPGPATLAEGNTGHELDLGDTGG